MKAFLNTPTLYLEIGQSSLKVLDGDDGLELSLDRAENGRLTPDCAERLTQSLRVFLKKHSWRNRLRAVCAIGARGVSLRRLTVPPATGEQLSRLLSLQIEHEFPLPPEELAWGYIELDPQQRVRNGAAPVQELLVVAVRREVLQEYADVLSSCGLTPVFTLGALVRSSLCPRPPDAYAVLDIGRRSSELISFENGVPSSLRVFPWGGEDITRAIEKNLSISKAEAEKLKIHLDGESAANGDLPRIQAAIDAELASLAQSLPSQSMGQKLYLSGESTRLNELAPRLTKVLRDNIPCERIQILPGEGRSVAILGLKKSCEEDGGTPPLVLHLFDAKETETGARPAQWKWAALAALLVFASVFLRYAETFIQKPRLERRLAELKAYRASLPNVDRELGFLQALKTNQAPFLEPIHVMANAAAPGTRIESLSINRRGDLSLRAAMKDSQQVVDFRSKLIDSGFFSTVVVEEQTPTPDRQKMVVRIGGQWKPLADPKPPAAKPTPKN